MKTPSPAERLTVLSGAVVIGFIVVDTIQRRIADPRALTQLPRFFTRMDFRLDGLLLALLLAAIAVLSWMGKRSIVRKAQLQTYVRVLWLFVCVWLIFLASAYLIALRWNTPRNKAYFPELASAFLQGRTYIEPLGSTSDLTFYDGHWYVSFPPLGALLMVPQVVWGGPEAVNSVHFSVFFGALNVVIVYSLVEGLRKRMLVFLDRSGSLWLAALFGFGTVHWYVSLSGHVWLVSQILTVTFSALSVVILLETGSLPLASIALGLSMLARPTMIFIWPFLVGLHLSIHAKDRLIDWRTHWRPILLSLIPIGVIIMGLLWYNFIRFDDPFEFGYRTMNVGAYLKPDLNTYGQFNLYFLPRNLQTMFLSLPHWDPSCGSLVPSPLGMSIFITSPILLFLFKARPTSAWSWSAWISVLLILTPLMLYYNTGSAQFGYRFLLDLIVPLLCLLALAFRERVSALAGLLIWVGILVNYLGVLWFHAGVCQ